MAEPTNSQAIINFINANSTVSSKEIETGLQTIALATIKRSLKKLVADNHILVKGKGKATRYEISSAYELLRPINVAEYFTKEIDERIIKPGYNHNLIQKVLAKSTLFTNQEFQKLQKLQTTYIEKSSQLTTSQYKKELERLAIDLSWKSSQIEGNIYS